VGGKVEVLPETALSWNENRGTTSARIVYRRFRQSRHDSPVDAIVPVQIAGLAWSNDDANTPPGLRSRTVCRVESSHAADARWSPGCAI
jgi:hypothetical protein